MDLISTIAYRWLGLCRKPPVIRTSQTDNYSGLEHTFEGSPDSGGGRFGAIQRGIGSALSGAITLNRNRQLLWFTLLAGLVLAGNAIIQTTPYIIGSTMHMHLDTSVLYILDFVIAFVPLLCIVFLLAGLVLSIPSKKEGTVSFFEGLTEAKKYFKALFLWSVILALAGMLIFRIWLYFSIWLPPELQFLHIFGFTSTLSEFPFNFLTLNPAKFSEIPGYGGRSLLLWIYPYGVQGALISSAINLLLLILTLFVVPLIVLEQKTIREAVLGSFVLMKKTWVEVAACAIFLGVVVYGVFLISLLVQAAHGMMITPIEIFTYHPSPMSIALGILYDLTLVIVAFVVATIGGIAALDLYNSVKSRQNASSPNHGLLS
jgi:hypothetical protein